jgi:hypothetical protein
MVADDPQALAPTVLPGPSVPERLSVLEGIRTCHGDERSEEVISTPVG